MRSVWILSACFIISFQNLSAQVGIGTTTPNSSAMLHVESTTKGVLFPRMTAAQRNAITPVNGLMVFDTDSNSLFIYQPLPLGWKPIKGMSSLKDLVAGNAAGDVLYWNGTDWILTPLANIFHFYYRDKDGDGYGDKYLTVMAISQPPGYVSNNSDCNDDNASVNPAAAEVFNGIDDNCDGVIDENAGPDLPDDSFLDTNGDGIDGTEISAIFVSSTGNDANPGTKSQPKRTIAAALVAAVTSAKTQIYVGDGTYAEQVTLVNGISIYGGYSSSNWSRNATNQAVIQGGVSSNNVIGIKGINISSATTVDRLWVITPSATLATGSNYGIYLSNCTALTFSNCTIHAGNGAAGAGGGAGAPGTSAGNNAVAGGPGSCSGANGGGGAGGTSCGKSGGAGGAGGLEGNNRGTNGSAGVGGTPGGAGGSGCSGLTCAGSPGQNGFNGADGVVGTNGTGGAGGSGTVVSGFWIGAQGGMGGPGSLGNGGGGGGGGGGQGGTLTDDGGGNGGGGGGAGGCGGSGGQGGTAGGGSFGVFVLNCNGIVLTNNDITSGSGGQGGLGGNRGIGGLGGPGAPGGSACTSEVGRGGDGGAGGRGGDGGFGGGGAGGASYAVYRSGTALTLPGSNTLTAGTGGAGGPSGGNAGTAGAAGTVF